MQVSIGHDRLNIGTFFPFAFTLDRELRIDNVQASLAKLIPGNNNLKFEDVFKCKRPWSLKPGFESIIEYGNTLFLIEIVSSQLVLRGQFIPLPMEEKLLFVGSPWITNTEELTRNNLILSDFSMSDSVVDMLQLLKIQDMSLKDIQMLNQKLDKQKEFYETILEHVPAELVVFDRYHRYLYVNPYALKDNTLGKWIIGKKDSEFCALMDIDFQTMQDRKALFEKASSCDMEVEREEEKVSQGGKKEFLLRRMRPVMDENLAVKYVISYGLDITKRKEVEEKLKKSEELYRLVFDATNDGIWDWDISQHKVFVNNRFKQMLGYQDLGVSQRELVKIIHEEDYLVFSKTIEEHFENNTPISVTLRFCHYDGTVRWMMCRGFALKDKNDNPYRMVGSITDITEVKQTEEMLQKAKRAAEESTEAKQFFLANMSHEIRTPLNGILGMARLLDKEVTDPKQRGFLSAISYSADNLSVIINDILDAAKIDAGKLDFEKVDFDLALAVRNLVQSLQYKVEERGIQLLLDMPFHQLYLSGDPFRLNQILLNLVNNAIKFTKKGHVEIVITVQKTQSKACLQFQIKDTGIGIPFDKLDTIFESFEQAQENTTREFGGTGLGLSISKKLVEMQGGKIWVESIFGLGSSFFVMLDFSLAMQPPKTDGQNAFPNPEMLRNVKILMAEDNEINQLLSAELLVSWGCLVTIVGNGREVLRAWQGLSFDLILMDIQMPIMNGIDATKHIRNSPSTKNKIPIIALTANALKGDREKYLSYGMDDHIAKPFNEAQLFAKIARLVNIVVAGGKQKGNNLYDYERLHSLFNGNKQLKKKVLEVFVQSVPPLLVAMQKSIVDNDYLLLSQYAHKLKTTIHSMAIHQLVAPVTELEEIAKTQQGEEQKIASLVKHLSHVLGELVKEFSQKIKGEE